MIDFTKLVKTYRKFRDRGGDVQCFGQYEYRTKKPKKGDGWEQTPGGKTWRRKKAGQPSKSGAKAKTSLASDYHAIRDSIDARSFGDIQAFEGQLQKLSTAEVLQTVKDAGFQPRKTKGDNVQLLIENLKGMKGSRESTKLIGKDKAYLGGKQDKESTAPTPRLAQRALQLANDLKDAVKSGELDRSHRHQLLAFMINLEGNKSIKVPELQEIAKELGSKEPIKNKQDGLKAVHDAIAAKTGNPKFFADRSKVVKFAVVGKTVTFADPDKKQLSPQKMEGVEIFASGEHQGEKYPPEKLKEIVRNFELLSTGDNPAVPVPVVITHQEEQPAKGEVETLWLKPDATDGDTKLVCDVRNLDAATAQAVRDGKLIKPSAELYEDFEHQGKKYGCVLRRVAYLPSGQPPEVKTLADLPEPKKMSAKLKRIPDANLSLPEEESTDQQDYKKYRDILEAALKGRRHAG